MSKHQEKKGKKIIKIIYVEDELTDFIAFERMLKKTALNFELVHFSEVNGLLNCRIADYDILFIDHFLNGYNSFEILQVLHVKGISIPTVIVSSLYDKQFLEQTTKNGASHYLNKNNLYHALDILKETFGLLPDIEQKEKKKYFSDIILELAREKETGLLAIDKTGTVKDFNSVSGILFNKGIEAKEIQFQDLFYENEKNTIIAYLTDLNENQEKIHFKIHAKHNNQLIRVKNLGYQQDTNVYILFLEANFEGSERENLNSLLKEHIIQNTRDSYIITDKKGTILLSNQSINLIFGLKTNALIGKHISELFPEDSIFIEGVTQNIKVKEKIEFKSRLSESSRKNLILHITIQYINTDSGYLIYIIRDKSSTELALEENEIKTRLINQVLQQTQICLLTLDEELNLKFLSEGIEKVLGFTSYELLGKNLSDLVFNSDSFETLNQNKIDLLSQEGKETSFSIELHNKLNESKKVYIQLRSIQKQNSKKYEILGTIQSINQIEKIISSQAQSGSLNNLFDNLKLIFYSVDTNFRLVVKSGFKSLSESVNEIKQGELMFSPFGRKEKDVEFNEIFEEVLKGKTKEKIIQNYLQFYLFQFSPLEINGKIEGVVVIGIDRTEETRLTKDLEESKKNLETTINSFDELIWSINKDGQLISFNKAFAFHYRRTTRSKPMPGSMVESFKIPSKEDERINELYKEALSGKSVMRIHHIWEEKIEFKVNPINNKNGEVIGVALLARNITNQEKLKKHFEVLSENIQDLVCIHDYDGNYIYLSPSIKGISGYSPDELIGKNPFQFFHPQDKIIVLKAYKKAIQNRNKPSNVIYRYRTINNEYRWVETNIKKIENPENNYSIITSTRAIDDRIANELEIKEKNKILTSISRGQEAFIQSASTKNGFELILQQLIEITQSEFGFIGEVKYDENEQPYLISHALTNISWDEESRKYYEKHYQSGIEFRNTESLFGQVLKTGKVYLSNKAKNDSNSTGTPIGHPIISQFFGIPLSYGDSLVGMIGLANNPNGYSMESLTVLEPLLITSSSILASYKNQQQQILTQAELEKSRADILAILTSLEDLVFEINESLVVENVWCSNEALLMLPREQVIGQNIKDFVEIDLLPEFISKIKIATTTGNTENIEYSLIIKGKETWFNAKINLIRNYQKQKRISLLIQDISERKESEFEIKKALEKEKELNELKSRFVSMTSHEFKTPLTCIKSSAEIMEMYLDNLSNNEIKFRKHLESINHEINRLTTLMNDVLVLGKIESDKMGCNKEEIDLIGISNLVLERQQLKYQLDSKIKLHLIGQTRLVLADKMQIDHILDNLVSNAIKYSAGKPVPEVSIEFLNNEFQIEVKDFGIGIPEDEKPQLFQSFYRAKNVENIDGTGLGLVIIKNFVNLHGGEISFETEENKGTIFHINIPG
jgi:PAS domain S-box-containing protein